MSDWISVKDKLPLPMIHVLWFDGNKTMHSSGWCPYYIDDIDKRGFMSRNYLHNYTHWMPLPAQPVECAKDE